MHYLPGRTSVGRALSVRGCGRVCSGSAGRRSRYALTGTLEHQRAVPQALNLLDEPRSIAWNLRCSFFGKCPRGPKAFLESLGVSRLRLYARTHLKWPFAILVRLLRRTTNTDTSRVECMLNSLGGAWLGHILVGRHFFCYLLPGVKYLLLGFW